MQRDFRANYEKTCYESYEIWMLRDVGFRREIVTLGSGVNNTLTSGNVATMIHDGWK